MRHALRPRLPWACALWLACSPLGATAAGFDCNRASTPTEQAVCADPVLQQRDGELAQAYRQALTATGWPAELKADQQAWLKRRDACGTRTECLRSVYAARLAQLQPAAVRGSFDWAGRWSRVGDEPAELSLERAAASHGSTAHNSAPPHGGSLHDSPAQTYRLELNATAGANAGSLDGHASLEGDTLRLHDTPELPHCRMLLRRVHRQIELDASGDCGAGQGVSFAGRYLPQAAAAALPAPGLLDLGLVRDAADDRALRLLLGRDYGELVERMNLHSTLTDLDGFGATVTDGFVRGLANAMRAVLMQAPHGRLWVAIRGFDAHDRDEIRYYTSVADWIDRLPQTVQHWRGADDPVPVRLMSADGKPLLRTP